MRQFGRFGALVRRTLAYVAAAAIAVTAAVAVPPGGREAVPVAEAADELVCSHGLCVGPTGSSSEPLVVGGVGLASARRISQGNSPVQITDPVVRERARAAWDLLESRAKAKLAAVHGVANDDRLLIGARPELRAYMYAELMVILEKHDARNGFPLEDPAEQAVVDTIAAALDAVREEGTRQALAEYDRWAADPCSYQFPAIARMPRIDNPACVSQLGTVIGAPSDYPPGFGDFQAAGAALAWQRLMVNVGDGRAFSDFTAAFAVLAGLGVAAIGVGALVAASIAAPALAAGAAALMGSTVAGYAAVAGGVGVFGGASSGATGIISASTAAASVSAVGVGVVLGVATSVILAAIVIGVRSWQLSENAGLRDDLVAAVETERASIPSVLGMRTDPAGQLQLTALFMSETLPDYQAEAYTSSTPIAWRPNVDRDFEVRAQNGALVGFDPTIEAIDWSGRPQSVTMVDGWFVVDTARPVGASLVSSPEWDLTFQYVDWSGQNRIASVHGDRFIVSGPPTIPAGPRADDPNGVSQVAPPPATTIADSIDITTPTGQRLRLFTNGNTPPEVRVTVSSDILEGRPYTLSATTSDAEGEAVSVRWFLEPTYGQVGINQSVEACVNGVFVDGGVTFTCPWPQFTQPTLIRLARNDGTYRGRVVATDARGATSTQWFTYRIADAAPTVTVTEPTGTFQVGDEVAIPLSMSDLGDDRFNVVVDWGDGTVETARDACLTCVAVDATGENAQGDADPTAIILRHVYANDSTDPDNTYDVRITVEGVHPQRGTSTAVERIVPVTVVDAVPTAVVNTIAGSISEGGSVTATGYVDPSGDPVTLTIRWGDGSVGTYTYPCVAGQPCVFGTTPTFSSPFFICRPGEAGLCAGTFWSVTHQYVDDPPGATTSFATSVELVDDDGRVAGSRTGSVTVANTAPSAFFNPSQPCPTGGLVICLPIPDPDTRDVSEGGTARLRGRVVDVPADTVTGTIDWGDGTAVETVTLGATPTWNGACTLMSPCPPNARFFDVSHVYAAAGEYTVTFVADDGDGGITTITTTVVVRANGSPIVVNDVIRTTEDVSVFAFAPTGLLTNDSDPERDPLTVTAFTQPANGTVNVNPDGSWFFTPAPNANGTSTFTYTVSDGRTSSTGTVTVEITPANDPPVATGPVSFAVFEDGTLCLFGCPTVLDRFRDVDGDALVAELVTPPANGTLSPALAADGTFGYVPAANRSGSDSFVFRVCERDRPTVCTVPVTATIDITSVNDAPSFVAGPSQTVTTRGTTVTVPGWATAISPGPADESGQQVTFSVVTDNPALFAADGAPAVSADGTLTFRPIAAGSTQVRVTAVDDGPGLSAPNENRSAPQVITISIGASADLSLTSSTNDPVLPGGTGEVRLVVANGGPDASSAVVRVELPAGLELVTPAPAGFDAVTSRWSVGSVPSGSSATLTLGVRMRDTGSTTVVAEIVSAAVSDPDSTPGNGTANGEDDHSSVTVTRRTPLADLRMTDQVGLRVASTPVVAGGDVTGLVGITNDGPQDTVAQVRVGLDGLSLRPGAPVPSGYSTTTGIWTVSVPSGTSRSIELPLTAARVGTLTITGEVVGSTIGDPDSTPGNGAVAGEDDRATASATAISRFALRFSTSNLRTAPVLLDGATVSGSIAVFVPTSTDIARVDFFLNDPTMSGAPRQVERSAPWDFGGTATGDRATMFSTRTLADGPNTITARVVLRNGTTQVVTATFTVSNPRPATRRLMVSTQGNRSAALPLDGRSVSGSLAVFVPDEAGIVLVEFRLDGRLIRTEFARPWDFGSTLGNGNAALVRFSPGSRTVTARIVFSDGSSDTLRAVFTAT